MSMDTAGARRRRAWVTVLASAFVLLQAPPLAQAAERSSGKPAARKAAEPAANARRAAATPRAVPAKSRPVASASGSSAASRKAAKSAAARLDAGARPMRAVAVQVPRNARIVRTSFAPREILPPRLSIGQAIGLHLVDDPLDLRSSVAMVIDQQTGETLYQKNADAVLPIASITKVMTSMVVLDAGLPLDETIEVTDADRDTERFSSSRLPVGSRISRAEALHLALMASENRAAHALGRAYPGGLSAFVAAMNAKAQAIGMTDSRFADPTGLSSGNVSNARDLARMVRVAYGYPQVRQWSTDTGTTVSTGSRTIAFRSTNRLVDDRNWDIGMQKTGYISEAGKCLVMQARIDGRPTIIVLLDAAGAQSRFADAQRLRKWVEQLPRLETPTAQADTRS